MLFGVLGLVCGVLLALAVGSSQALAASWAPGVEATLPANATAVLSLDSVSCASAGNCSAVGTYGDSSGIAHPLHPLLLNETGGTWAPGIEATLPPSNQFGPPFPDVRSVSCASAGDCSAVGSYGDPSGNRQGLLLNETGGTWAPGIEATLPANAASNSGASLSLVSCPSAGNCSAVGTYLDSAEHPQVLLLTETGGTWAAGVEGTLPANAGSVRGVSSVSCASAGNCSAVGTYADSSGIQHALLLNETGGAWAPGMEAPLPANAAPAPLPPRGAITPVVALDFVSCPSAGSCSAVGTYADSSGQQQGLLLTETGGVWAPGVEATLPANAGSPSAFVPSGVGLGSVSCASAGNCSAVGTYPDSSGHGQGLLVTETNGSWSAAVEATLPANAASDANVSLDSVSCVSAGNCSAVGTYVDTSGVQHPLLLNQTGGTWPSGVAATLPANAGSDPLVRLDSVSCASAGGCSAVGTYPDRLGHPHGLLVSTLAVLSRLRVSPKTFVLSGRRVNGRCVKETARNRTHRPCTRPVKLGVSYQLNFPAQVTITIKRVLLGRLSKRRCVAPTRNNRSHRRCTRLVPVRGSLTKNGGQGSNRFMLNGRIGGHKLPPGTYQLTATPSFGSTQTVTFRIAG
jgi:hypothetical protein